MDDVNYLTWMPHISNLWASFLSEVQSYWIQGRFYPVKYLANLLKWRFLPLQPSLFHFLNLFILSISIWVAGLSVVDESKKKKGFNLIFICSLFFLQRPLWDVIALNSIAETWVIFFSALGFYALAQNSNLYLFCFGLASLSKEPAAVLFLASATSLFINKKIARAFRDLFLFCVFAAIALKAKNAGSYLDSYSLISILAFKNFWLGLFKIILGALPLIFLLLQKPRGVRQILEEKPILPITFFFATVFYLGIISGRNVAGYLLIPASFFIQSLILWVWDRMRPQKSWGVLATLLTTLIFILTVFRFLSFTNGINGPSRLVNELTSLNEKTILVINGPEAWAQAKTIIDQKKAPISVFQEHEFQKAVSQPKDQKLVVIELSSYFGRLSKDSLKEWSSLCKNSLREERHLGYRVFYGL